MRLSSPLPSGTRYGGCLNSLPSVTDGPDPFFSPCQWLHLYREPSAQRTTSSSVVPKSFVRRTSTRVLRFRYLLYTGLWRASDSTPWRFSVLAGECAQKR
jgi:hypothetical protein